jgi:hypothetical protein
VTEEELLAAVVAYVRRRAQDYGAVGEPNTCSNMYSLARELEGDPGVLPHFEPRGEGVGGGE